MRQLRSQQCDFVKFCRLLWVYNQCKVTVRPLSTDRHRQLKVYFCFSDQVDYVCHVQRSAASLHAWLPPGPQFRASSETCRNSVVETLHLTRKDLPEASVPMCSIMCNNKWVKCKVNTGKPKRTLRMHTGAANAHACILYCTPSHAASHRRPAALTEEQTVRSLKNSRFHHLAIKYMTRTLILEQKWHCVLHSSRVS